MTNQKSFFNAHTHIFTLNHVPDKFARGYFSIFGWTIRISWLKKSGLLRWLIKTIPKLKKSDYDVAERLINLVKHGIGSSAEGITQQQILDTLMGYYPPNTKFVILPMDMHYMGAGNPKETYESQIETLEKLKDKSKYSNLIYPFIFADPRRKKYNDEDYNTVLKQKLQSGKFCGIKMYPALGYWPFDKDLEQVYDFALKHKIPITSHCIHGTVHDRDKKKFEYHPVKTKAFLPGKKSKDYAQHFNHPINYHVLLDSELISKHWGKQKDYSNLKICFAHFGGSDEWGKYLKYPWVADKEQDDTQNDYPSLRIDNWNFDIETQPNHYSWFAVIKDMVHKYENVYADISFMLYNQETWPLIKMLLTSDAQMKKRILFGTDYYVVTQKGAERELSIGIRSYLGEELFFQIANDNVKEFLGSDFTKF